GHPVRTLKDENKEIQNRIDRARKALEGGDEGAARDALGAVRVAATHYSWKGDLIYPLLKTKYGVSGPSDVMWGVDDEIRDELGRLAKAETLDETWKKDVSAVLTRAEEMIYKENNILTPICVQYFSDSEWALISKELLAYAPVAGERKALPEAEAASQAAVDERVAKYAGNTENAGSDTSAPADATASESAHSGDTAGIPVSADTRIELGREGHLTVREIAALLNTIPGEISFVDENDINRYFNAGAKLFKRPQMALDREVYSCHPPKVEQMARAIIAELRAGTKDKVSVPMVKAGKKVIVNYMAVRDEAGYVGTLEFVQEVPEFPQM
ncbi:MAG: PAS domain-containing protein, partial [Lachnospiraceae bacterium]|nr:PAS domain-containing protein [Lachnospiraceae bacterium]